MNCETCAKTFSGVHELIRHVSNSDRHWNSSTDYYSCTPCSMTIHNIPHVVQHIESGEHSIMALATGILFDAQASSPGSRRYSFPPLDFCILCSCRNVYPFENHLKSPTHKKIAWIMRAICRKKKINYINYSPDSHVSIKTQEFVNKIINMKEKEFLGATRDSDYSLKFVCVLCNIYFNKHEYYKQHLACQSHQRMGQFMIKLSHVVKDLDIVGCTDSKVVETFSNSFPPLYHCEVCSLWIENSPSFIQHISGYPHKRIDDLFSKLSNKRNGETVRLRLKREGFANVNEFNHLKDYCKLCAAWCLDGKMHLVEDNNHKKIESFFDGLTDESDKKFIKIYIEAQARVNFSDSPPNYCKFCNILHSRYEKYKQHLKSVEHKQTKLSYSKEKNKNGEKASEMLKTSSSQSLGKVRRKSFINYNHFYSTYEALRRNNIKRKEYENNSEKRIYSRSHRASNSSWFEFEEQETISRDSSQLHFGDGETNSNFSPPELCCELCNYSSTNPFDYEKHLFCDKHKKMRKMLNKGEKKICLDAGDYEISRYSHPLQYNCELCDVFNYSSREYDEHCENRMHKKNQWFLYVLMQKPLSV